MPESSAAKLAAVLSGQSTVDGDSDTQVSTYKDPVEVSRCSRLVRETLGDDWSRADLDDALDGLVGPDPALRSAVVARVVNPRAGRVRGKVRTGDAGAGRSATSPRKSSASRLAQEL